MSTEHNDTWRTKSTLQCAPRVTTETTLIQEAQHERRIFHSEQSYLSWSKSTSHEQLCQNTPHMIFPRQACQSPCIIRRAPSSDPANQLSKPSQPYACSSLSNEEDIVEQVCPDREDLELVAFLAFLTLLGLLLGLWCALLLAVDNQPSPGLLLVPLEACENRGLKLIIGL